MSRALLRVGAMPWLGMAHWQGPCTTNMALHWEQDTDAFPLMDATNRLSEERCH
jgi:hypothetical protein